MLSTYIRSMSQKDPGTKGKKLDVFAMSHPYGFILLRLMKKRLCYNAEQIQNNLSPSCIVSVCKDSASTCKDV